MVSEEAAFLASIAANPKDDLGYLVFADWLQEQGEEARAGLVRDPQTRALLGPTLADPFPALKSQLVARTHVREIRGRFAAFGAAGVPTLIEVLSSGVTRQVLAHALDCVREIGPAAGAALPAVTALVNHDHQSVRNKAMLTIRKRGLRPANEPALVEPLYRAILSEDYELRNNAIRTLGEDAIRTQILPRLDHDRLDADPKVRLRVVYALRAIDSPECIALLLTLIADADREVKLAVMWGVFGRGLAVFSDSVVPLLKDADTEIRRMAAAVCVSLVVPGSADLLEALSAALTDSDPSVACECAKALGRIGPLAAPAIPAILAHLPRMNAHEWDAAMTALLQIDRENPEALFALRERLHDLDPDRAIYAALCVSDFQISDPSLIPAMLRLCSNRESISLWARCTILRYLVRVAPNSVVLDVARGLLAEDGDPICILVDIVIALGHSAAPLLPDLEAVLLRGQDIYRLGDAIAATGPEGLEMLLRLLRDGPNAGYIGEVFHGLECAEANPSEVLSRLRELLHVYAADSATRTQLVSTILSMGPTAAEAIPDLMLTYGGRPNEKESLEAIARMPEAFHAWLATAHRYYSPPYRPVLYEGILDVLLLLEPQPAVHLPHIRTILAIAGEIRQSPTPAPRDIAIALALVTKVCRVAGRMKRSAGVMAGEIARILTGQYGPHTSELDCSILEVLSELGNAAVVPTIVPRLKDADEPTAAWAATALGKLCSPDAVDALIDALSDHRARVRRESVDALRSIGVASERLLDRLQDLTRDDSEDVRNRADVAHRWLSRPRKPAGTK